MYQGHKVDGLFVNVVCRSLISAYSRRSACFHRSFSAFHLPRIRPHLKPYRSGTHIDTRIRSRQKVDAFIAFLVNCSITETFNLHYIWTKANRTNEQQQTQTTKKPGTVEKAEPNLMPTEVTINMSNVNYTFIRRANSPYIFTNRARMLVSHGSSRFCGARARHPPLAMRSKTKRMCGFGRYYIVPFIQLHVKEHFKLSRKCSSTSFSTGPMATCFIKCPDMGYTCNISNFPSIE